MADRKKRNIIENLSPVIAKLFIPLFIILLVSFLIAMIYRGSLVIEDRNLLILVDIVLILVTSMCFYEISSRSATELPQIFDYFNFVLIVIVLIVDIIALGNIILRIGADGFTINKTSALAENILLAVNLGGIMAGYILFFKARNTLERLLSLQGRFIYVYGIWFVVAAFILPIVFRFR